VGDAAGHIRCADVTRRANLAAGTLYYHWLNQEEYIVDLVDFVLDSLREEREERADHQGREVFLAKLDEGSSFEEAIREGGNSEFDYLLNDSSFFLQMGLWAAHRGDEQIAERLRGIYQRVEACWVPVFADALKRQGRKMRPPFTEESLGTTLIALAEGLALRTKVDPDSVPQFRRGDKEWSLFATLTMCLYTTMTEPVDAPDGPEEAWGMPNQLERGTGHHPTE